MPACCISWIAASDSSYCRVFFPVRKEKMRTCRSGRERVTKWDEVGERVMALGTQRAYRSERGFSEGLDGVRCNPAHLFKLEQIGLALVLPQPLDIFRRAPRLLGLPILDEPLLVGRDDGVVALRVLEGMRRPVSLPEGRDVWGSGGRTHHHKMYGRAMQLFERVQRLTVAPAVVDVDARAVRLGAGQGGAGQRLLRCTTSARRRQTPGLTRPADSAPRTPRVPSSSISACTQI